MMLSGGRHVVLLLGFSLTSEAIIKGVVWMLNERSWLAMII